MVRYKEEREENLNSTNYLNDLGMLVVYRIGFSVYLKYSYVAMMFS